MGIPGRRRIGLTGGIASGKSTVADLLAAHGALVVDSDVLAREVVELGTPGLAAVVAAFGAAVLDDSGRLDRAALGRVVFADASARRRLEAIIHPAVRARAAELESAAPAGQVVVQVIPLLVETDQADAFDVVVVVDVDPTTQRDRLLARGGLSVSEADARIAAQASRRERLAAADVVVTNDGTRADLEKLVDELWARVVAV